MSKHYYSKAFLFLWMYLSHIPQSYSFFSVDLSSLSLSTHKLPSQRNSFNVRLYAKTVSKKKNKANKNISSRGGFGAAPSTKKKQPNATKKVDDDFAAFPPLEAKVQETLVPSSFEAATVADDLSDEIYERLAQIYGFPNFNYLNVEETEKEVEGLNFGDLLSSSKSESTKETSSSLLGPSSLSSDFSDLIASASGETSTSTTTAAEISTELPISKLPAFEKFRVLHVDPLVLSIDDFLTESECDTLIAHSDPTSSKNKMNNPTNIHMAPMMSRSKTVGKDAMSQAQRTSTTWFHHFQGSEIAPLLSKSCRLFGLDNISKFEEPQTVRYRGSEKFTWHLDALSPSDELNKTGGQRAATLLVYLNSLKSTDENNHVGGNTMFRDLGTDGAFLKIPPKKGSALLFFPAAGGIPNSPFDIRTLHCGEAVAESSPNDKWIAQLWLRQKEGYKPTAPPGNNHVSGEEDIAAYCTK